MYMEMDYDKINDGVAFRESDHTYFKLGTDIKYISVTTLIGKFEQPYDRDFWSGYKALQKLIPEEFFNVEKKVLLDTHKLDKQYYLDTYSIREVDFNLAQQDILDEWAESNRASCERGTAIHSRIEHEFLDAGTCELQKYGLGGKFNVRSGDTPLDEEKGVYPEYLIHVDDGDLHLAGQIDLLIKDGNDIYIYDWKTNKKLDEKSYFNSKTKKYTMMKYPLTDIMDCNKCHYTLQLSMYAWMIQHNNPDLNIRRLKLVHYDHQGNVTEHELEYKKDTVERLIRYWKKQGKIEERRALRKPIEF